MHELELAITVTECQSDARSADAWFVPGTNATEWLTSVLDAGCTTAFLRFRAIGKPGGGAIGCVVSGVDGTPAPSWLPYSAMTERLFVPTKSTFFPRIDQAELDEIAAADPEREFVWHPTIGLIAFDSNQILDSADLFTLPSRIPLAWDHADPGLWLNDRLAEVTAAQQMTLEMIFEAGQDDIGSKADQISEAPRSPDESSSFNHLISQSLSPIARAAKWIAARAPGGAAQSTWINSMGEWANRIIQGSGIDRTKRSNELERLMSMLEKDPDTGLRYAIPFGGDAARGTALGGNELVSQNLNYGSFQGGGGPAAYWDMSYEVQTKLTARYRQLAQRELSLGRYQRAAYIYAALLGEHSSAAAVLKEGGYFREAAAIYQEKLGQEHEAAQCLLLGGLWSEAIQILEQLGDWTTVAETLEKLEETTAAERAWHKACEQLVQNGDFRKAASLQEERLNNVAAAEELLERGWTEARDGLACLQELFDLFARTSSHHKSADWAGRLVTENQSSSKVVFQETALLVELSKSYPNEEVQTIAFSGSRRVIARQLEMSDDRDRRRFLPLLQRLRPDDKLLSRDCHRYLQQEPSRRRLRQGQIALVDRFNLDPAVKWQTAVRAGERFVVAGYRDNSLVIASWLRDEFTTLKYDTFSIMSQQQGKILLVHLKTNTESVLVHVVGANFGLVYRTDFMNQQSSTPTTSFDSGVVAAASAANGVIWTASFGLDGVDVKGVRENGTPVAQHTLPVSISSDLPSVILQAFSGDLIACGIDDLIYQIESASESRCSVSRPDLFVVSTNAVSEGAISTQRIELAKSVRSSASVSAQARDRIAVTFESGGLMHWWQANHSESFGIDLIDPVVDFMPNDDLVVADQTGSIEVYETRQQRLRLKGTFEADSGNVVSLLALVSQNARMGTEFILVREDGRVEAFGYQ